MTRFLNLISGPCMAIAAGGMAAIILFIGVR